MGKTRRSGRPAGPRLSSLGLDAGTALGAAIAVPAFVATFRGPRNRFWNRMTATGLGLGSLALVANPKLRQMRIGPREAALGFASAVVLHATFQVGDRFARRFVPGGESQIRDIYSLRELEPPARTATRLVTVIGPAEELFWRGLVQEALMRRYGRWTGAAMAALAYSAVHVTTGNFTVMGAAGVAGAHWCALYAAGVPIGALIVSHCVWDVWIFLLQPTGEVTPLEAG